MNESIKAGLMIMSLGGSPEPLIKSIKTYCPEYIIFLASHDSVSLAGDIFKAVGFKPASVYEITENPNLMYECYRAACRCIDRVKKAGVSLEDVMVDYTGGTKVMTAALVMATAGYPFKFNYVGGERRNKDGVGTVIDGHEKMFEEMSPWSIFAEEERRKVVTLFNQGNFSAVIEVINFFDREPPLQIRNYFRFVNPIADGFLNWDQFNHKAAFRRLSEGFEALAGYISVYDDSALKEFMVNVQSGMAFVGRIIEETDGMKRYHRIIITDLLNNAKRRISDRRYDDAAARIYRALELYGQIIFQEVAGCHNDRVPQEAIPEHLRKEFCRKYRDPGRDALKLPQTATFEFLKGKGHEVGLRFFERHKAIKDIQSNRNGSILAHGINPISEKAINMIFETVIDFVQESYFFDFPKLP
ncbi:conserved hypothetical protein [uncultured Desulfobacterium sp.]|uniref:Csm6 6H domain-containing protein n=1 Tax=uncultured Desulfobacterium sp. TaxID=201089 RepID=A0A445MU56_9BACT|nr:conserved hypothetical protein [uncultured Desulfobacterium sp.]